jgi:RNase P subunit RPR2
MVKGKFPVYETHKVAKKMGCFNCCTDLTKEKHELSKFAAGDGKYCVKCPNCGYSTWYDIKREVNKRRKDGDKI